MKLLIKNVGKIDNAEIDIQGITAIIGVNGTGKSTINKSLYCILNSFLDTSSKIIEIKERNIYRAVDRLMPIILMSSGNRNISRFPSRWGGYSRRISRAIMEQYQSISIDEKISRNNIQAIIAREYDFNIDFEKLAEDIDNIFNEVNRKDAEYINEIINRQFLVEFSEQINCLDNETIAEVTLTADDSEIYVKFKNNRVEKASKQKAIQNTSIYIDTPYLLDYYGNYDYFDERDEAHTKKLIANFRRKITDADNIERLQESTKKLKKVKDILDKIVDGKFDYDEIGNITYESKSKSKLELKNLATGLKTFVIIKKLIENGTIDENTVLIIDEPEVHLHPEWQLKLAEILVLLNKELNIKILLSTHSPYFLRAIQVYSAKYGVANRERIYYIKNQENGLSVSEEITGDTTEVFEQLTRPFIELEDEVQS